MKIGPVGPVETVEPVQPVGQLADDIDLIFVLNASVWTLITDNHAACQVDEKSYDFDSSAPFSYP
jgi:hypothetical protein